MTNLQSKLSKISSSIILIGLFIFSTTPIAFGQTNFNPPSILPGDNTDIGGYGGACVGIANMIREGTISLRQIPCFIKFFSQTLIALAGSVAVIFVMIGGYRYTVGGEEAKADAKSTITYALLGLAISLMAWILVDIVLQLATN